LTAQDYSRKQFDYYNLEEKATAGCTDEVSTQLEESVNFVENNNSEQGLAIAETLFKKGEATACPDLYVAYATALFRHGQWEEGVSIAEQGIEKYGSNPELISRKGNMCLEMAELGPGKKHIDGNAVYSGRDKGKYDEAKFKEENYKTAAKDFDFLVKTYDNRYQEILILGYIQKQLKNFEASDKYFKQLIEDKNSGEEYAARAQLFLAENYMEEKKIEEAETLLLQLEEAYPRNSSIQEKLIDLYTLKKDTQKVKERKEQASFYQLIPSQSSLAFTKENFDLLIFFADEKNAAKAKSAKLKEVVKKREAKDAIEICLSILKMHANHGNGIEEESTQHLIKFGTKATDPVINLFLSGEVSTCTITNLADVLATVKDPKGWTPLVNYLPVMANMPMTMIPPMIPQMIIKFDKEEGTKVLVEFVKPIIQNEKNAVKSSNPFGELNFSENLMFSALKEIKKEKVLAAAKQYEYSEEETKVLLDKIYKE
jgi:tetratricopeptide (TPR) repeat protein